MVASALTRFIWSSVTSPVSHSTFSSVTIIVTGASPEPSSTITTACGQRASSRAMEPPRHPQPPQPLTSYTSSWWKCGTSSARRQRSASDTSPESRYSRSSRFIWGQRRL